MKKFTILFWLLLCIRAFAANPSFQQTTNMFTAELSSTASGFVFVDGIRGNDTTNTGTALLPFLTLTNAQRIATNGMTVYGVRGTFTDSNLGKPGVNWYFNDNVWLSGTPSFMLGTNGVTNLVVGGMSTFTNTPVFFAMATNCQANITAKAIESASVAGIAQIVESGATFGVSNRLFVNVRSIPRGVVLSNVGTEQSSNVFFNATIIASELLQVNTTTSTSGNSNNVFKLSAPRMAPNGINFANSGNTVIVQADLFSRFKHDGSATIITALQSNYVWNVNILTTNDLNTNIAGIWRGQVNVLR